MICILKVNIHCPNVFQLNKHFRGQSGVHVRHQGYSLYFTRRYFRRVGVNNAIDLFCVGNISNNFHTNENTKFLKSVMVYTSHPSGSGVI